MYNDYDQLKNKIRITYFSRLYNKTILLCKKYYKLIRRFHRKSYVDTRQDLFFINYYLGCSYKKVKDLKQSVHYLKQCIRYALNDTNLNQARFILGKCYYHRGHLDKAMNNFKQCLYFYNYIGNNNNRAKVLFYMARVTNNLRRMQNIINIMEGLKLNNNDIRNCYIKLIHHYLDHENIKDAVILIGNIKNTNIQQELINTIKSIPQIA